MDVALRILDGWLAGDSARTNDVARLGTRIAVEHPDEGYEIVQRATAHATVRHEWPAAVEALQEFLRWAPRHVAALTQLIEIAVDAGLDDTLTGAQSALADAYLEAEQASEAKFILADLLSRHPDDEQVRERLKQARTMLGEPEFEEPAIAEPPPEPAAEPSLDISTLTEALAQALSPQPVAPPPPPCPVPPSSKSPPNDPPLPSSRPTPSPRTDAFAIDLGFLADYEKTADPEPPREKVEIPKPVEQEPSKRPTTAEID